MKVRALLLLFLAASSASFALSEEIPVLAILDGSTSSRISPAWVSGSRPSDAHLSASIDGTPISVALDGENLWSVQGGESLAGIPLTAGSARSLSVTDGSTTCSCQISWTPTDLADTYGIDPVVLRLGDSLLITDSRAQESIEIDSDFFDEAGFQVRLSASAGEKIPVKFERAGTVVVRTRIDGVISGKISVQVLSADIPNGLACQIGFQRTKNVSTSDSSLVEFISSDPRRAQVSTLSSEGGAIVLGVQPLDSNPVDLIARLNVSPHQIIARRRIDSFTLRDISAIAMPVVQILPDGSKLGEATLYLTPYVPDLDFEIYVFVSGVVFEDGTIVSDFNSSAFYKDQWAIDGRYRHEFRLTPGVAELCGQTKPVGVHDLTVQWSVRNAEIRR